mgnify:CR=1 FL=1
MSSVNLPFKMPMFSTYHNIAGAGVVAANNPTSDIWYYIIMEVKFMKKLIKRKSYKLNYKVVLYSTEGSGNNSNCGVC